MNIITYNVNGIRAAINKGFLEWLKNENPDILCLQETKADASQVDFSLFEQLGYNVQWHEAEKKGYSGVAILSKPLPKSTTKGCGIEYIDKEGRILLNEYDTFTLVSVYIPSGSSGEERQDIKMKFLEDFLQYTDTLKNKYTNIILAGDFNICHKPIDIHDPIRNAKSSGFLPEEREWFDRFVEHGWVDSFRVLNQEPHQYTWWTYRAGARAKNKGWRIDYQMLTPELKDQLTSVHILSDVYHSDHCPYKIEINV
ncbi:exodeoxyribonuclease [Thermaurantimonas aggregans]|uniref:Exodeoxyribonuclease n=1 Tax=Thermaurantimonas aggregans TaxID=2173829 RepID=A0A401XL43_9FLAO|nr:exodeoxyribonuclease III [Thermaurantimonas aggregans]MCX8148177.1 exodeoxyribonuclease III [Thermaurantimonas aggregans]GCD77755.1 exodeoxyribonuclease [Thermaurantimonas aggregans]